MKKYIQRLQDEIEKRSNEAVVSAARVRELASELAEIHSSETTEPSPTSAPLQLQQQQQQQQQQLEDEPGYTREYFLILMLFLH